MSKQELKDVVEFRLYELPLDIPIVMLDGEEWRISDKLSSRLHFHNCIEIGFCHSDSGTLVFEDDAVPFNAGDVTVIPRYLPHTTCSAKGTRSLWSYIFIDLEGFVSDMLAVDDAHRHSYLDYDAKSILFTKENTQAVNFLSNAIMHEFRHKKIFWVSKLQALCLALYYELRRVEISSAGIHKRDVNHGFVLKPALVHIQQKYMDPITVKELADTCHLSETHFRRMFTSIMGTPPVSFVNATRIKKACNLINTTDMSIISVAEVVGFSSIASFNRNFKQMTGINPREYRNTAGMRNIVSRQKYVLNYKGWLTAEDVPEHAVADDN